jgi:hypothetical protein
VWAKGEKVMKSIFGILRSPAQVYRAFQHQAVLSVVLVAAAVWGTLSSTAFAQTPVPVSPETRLPLPI